MLSLNSSNAWLKTTCIRSPLPRLRRLRVRPPAPYCVLRRSASTSGVFYCAARHNWPNTANETKQQPDTSTPPEPPVICCGSGCQNCVWIQYAEELARRYKNGGQMAMDAIERVDDPTLRSFLLTEIAMQQRRK
ncbi:hypothetical protein LSAT2_025415 [Lamellibrachia satsuma]|nr:hypothetical protein LSAT2_025415 [Lamellibrachia satsuma]